MRSLQKVGFSALMASMWPLSAVAQQVAASPPPVLTYANVLSTIGTAFAVIAFFRPNIAKVVRKWVNRITFFPLSNVELGFGQLGPTIGFAGTLLGVPNDQFVKSMSVEVVRKADNLTHRFQWAAFKPVLLIAPDMKDIRAALGFSLRAGDGLPINIVFSDPVTRAKVQDQLSQFRAGWHSYQRAQSLVSANMTPVELAAHYKTFTDGSHGPLAGQVHSEIQRLFYWADGEYTATTIIETANPNRRFETALEFSLSKQESQNLLLGIIESMVVSADQPSAGATFVSPALTTRDK